MLSESEERSLFQRTKSFPFRKKGAVAQEHSLWLDREGGGDKKHVCSVFRDLATVFLQPAGGISTKNGFFFLS